MNCEKKKIKHNHIDFMHIVMPYLLREREAFTSACDRLKD